MSHAELLARLTELVVGSSPCQCLPCQALDAVLDNNHLALEAALEGLDDTDLVHLAHKLAELTGAVQWKLTQRGEETA